MSDYVTEYDRLLTRLTSPPRTARSTNYITKPPRQTEDEGSDTETASTKPTKQKGHLNPRESPQMPPSTNDAPGRVPTSNSSANRARPEPPPSPLLKDDDETFGDTKWPKIKHFLSSHPDDPDEVTEESMKKIEEEVRELVKAMENGRRATPPRESQEDTSEGHVEGGSVERWAQRVSSLRRYRRASTEVQKAKEVVQHKAPPKAARTKENSQPMQRHRSRKGTEPATSSVSDDGEESMSDNPKIRNYARTHENAFFGMGTLAYEKIWPAFPPPMRWSDKEGWTKGGQG